MKKNLSLTKFCKQYTSPSERIEFFKGHQVEVEKQLMPDDDKGTSWLRPLSHHYRPVCRGVRVGDWHTSPSLALSEGRRFLSRWDGLTAREIFSRKRERGAMRLVASR